MIVTNKSAELDPTPPPAYDTLSIHQSGGTVPSIPDIIITNPHEHEAGPSPIAHVGDRVEPPRRWAHRLPRSRSEFDFTAERHDQAGFITKLPADVDKLLPERPPIDTHQTLPATVNSSSCQKRKHHKERRTSPSSWLSLFSFTSSRNTKQVRQSVLGLVNDLVISPHDSSGSINPYSNTSRPALTDPHEILASCAESCSARNISISTLIQEAVVADHSPIYWAIVNYRPLLLDALLRHVTPLTPATLSEMRKACLITSNQALFHHLRLKVGLCASGLRSATDRLLLGSRPPDDVHIEQGRDGAFAATLDIAMWQKRIRAVGSVSVEFVASGRIFALTFFTTDRPKLHSKSARSKRALGPWHVSLSVLEHSLPTYVDAVVIVDQPPPVPPPKPAPCSPRKKGLTLSKGHVHRASFSGGEKGSCSDTRAGFGSQWDFNYNNQVHKWPPSPAPSSSSGAHTRKHQHAQTLPPPHAKPNHALVQARSSPSLKPPSSPWSSHMVTPVLDKITAHASKKQFEKLKSISLGTGERAPVVLRLCAGETMLAYRTRKKEDPNSPLHLASKLDTWSEHGVTYVSAITVPLGEPDGVGLMFDDSQHLAPDGSLRARLEVKLVRTTVGGKDCIIC